ncbi:sugar phosphate isomerase/epimerase [Pullulanibacillus sp. KACC 23026]|uniref:sugar phosphate isomerase/epimerase family protein n=1 Tax=Pullulanibacillus sp. KACC 23026 TaxID=3028315 RepID=UPI0023B0D9DE|nr:sugar phosphate isomerase/epimerase family protein [Pullulanibacillus sp. KACC 23026]WEG12580.1 sugar phosphate isomerase/epimerase [Pullulanibacillus sp. KACC 23026]
MTFAFMTANFVARELNYTDSLDWGKCHQATVEAFHGPQFSAKFEELILEIKGMGFDAIELWVAHLDPFKATPEMIEQANAILKKYEMSVISYTAGFGEPGITHEDAVQIFETAKAIGAPVFAQGFHPDNGPLVSELAEAYTIKVGLENHPEKTPQEVIDKVGPFSPWVGSAIDTGWFATQGYDPVQAVYDLKDYIVHVHLKDVKAPGAHDTCALGDGIVDIKGVMAALKEIGFTGPMTVEHEPHTYDPTEEVKVSLERVKAWQAELEK